MKTNRNTHPISIRIRPEAAEALRILRRQSGGLNLSRAVSDWLIALERLRRDEPRAIDAKEQR